MNLESIASWAEQSLTNAGALRELRKSHLQQFKTTGFAADPEAYKFTKVSSFIEGLKDLSVPEIKVPESVEFYELNLKNGDLVSRPSIRGVTVRLMEDASVYEEFAGANPFTHLHHGLSRIFQVDIDKNTKLDRPLKFNFLDADLSAATIHFRIAAFGELTVIEDHTATRGTHISATETYFTVGEGAKVEHIQVDQAGEQGIHHHQTFAKVSKDGKYNNVIVHEGGKLVRRNTVTELKGSGAHASSFALYLLNQEEHSDLNTVIHHLAADSTSQQIAKGILDGSSKGIFTGKIHIHKDAQRVNSGQLNKNLILSKKAQAHSQPQLEIFADDVKCSHGSTTGQLSDDELFYFKARGIPENKARTLLASGFGLEIVLKIENMAAREFVKAKVMKALETKYKIGGQHG